MDYQQFQDIKQNLVNLCLLQPKLHPPNESLSLPYYWKCEPNFIETDIYGANKEIIGSESCYFILPCDEKGTPLEPIQILLREWRDIRQYL